MHPAINVAIKAARAASNIIMRFADRLDTLKVTEKGRNDFVSEVDRMAEQEIIEILQNAYPNYAVLAEESGYQEGQDFCWIIDPLDGTTNFLHGFPQYAISIALVHRNQIEIAVIFDPIRNELFTASRGGGAHLNNRRMRVSQVAQLKGALIGTGFPFRDMSTFQHYIKMFEAVVPQAAGVRRAGAAVLDLAYVAAGRFDGFWESGLKPWDMAAGVLLIKEAGGIITDYQGGDKFLESGQLVAGNPKIYKSLFDLIKPFAHK